MVIDRSSGGLSLTEPEFSVYFSAIDPLDDMRHKRLHPGRGIVSAPSAGIDVISMAARKLPALMACRVKTPSRECVIFASR
jgi:hypothetical protein